MGRSNQSSTEISNLQPGQSESAAETNPYGDQAYVLAATDDISILESKPTVILCPNCGDVVATHKQGLPQVVPQFDTCCTTCQVELRRWCAVAVDAAYRASVEPPTLTAMTQAYWNEWLWAGITNYKGQPRNDEYTNRLSTKASEFGWDWELTCPLCRRGISQLKQEIRDVRDSLDYHHWSTNPDQGITLCRECHDIIGFDSYDNQVEERAHEWGFRSRNDLQIVRLALREAIATDQPVQLEMATDLVDRYNLVQSTAEVKELLRAVLLDSNLYDRFVDDSLYQGLANC
jgi:hypothetical protein